MHCFPGSRHSQGSLWVVGEAKIGEVLVKGRINMAVVLALRTGRNTSAQDEGANRAVETASLGAVKQVCSFRPGCALTTLCHNHMYSNCRGLKEG